MDFLHKLFQTLKKVNKVQFITPSSFSDIIKQLESPAVKKEKTPLQVFQDAFYKESMSKLEVEMLKMEPEKLFTGYQYWFDNEKNKFCDWVPCIVRPEVIYCSYGKN